MTSSLLVILKKIEKIRNKNSSALISKTGSESVFMSKQGFMQHLKAALGAPKWTLEYMSTSGCVTMTTGETQKASERRSLCVASNIFTWIRIFRPHKNQSISRRTKRKTKQNRITNPGVISTINNNNNYYFIVVEAPSVVSPRRENAALQVHFDLVHKKTSCEFCTYINNTWFKCCFFLSDCGKPSESMTP